MIVNNFHICSRGVRGCTELTGKILLRAVAMSLHLELCLAHSSPCYTHRACVRAHHNTAVAMNKLYTNGHLVIAANLSTRTQKNKQRKKKEKKETICRMRGRRSEKPVRDLLLLDIVVATP